MEPRKTMATILVVDDAQDILELLRRNLEGMGHRVHCARVVPEAIELLGRHRRAVLAGTKGNRSHAARILGIDRKTLREKLRRMG
jgi:DNA-binding NtrC family response regulator